MTIGEKKPIKTNILGNWVKTVKNVTKLKRKKKKRHCNINNIDDKHIGEMGYCRGRLCRDDDGPD